MISLGWWEGKLISVAAFGTASIEPNKGSFAFKELHLSVTEDEITNGPGRQLAASSGFTEELFWSSF